MPFAWVQDVLRCPETGAPPTPAGLVDVAEHEVYDGLGYLIFGTRNER